MPCDSRGKLLRYGILVADLGVAEALTMDMMTGNVGEKQMMEGWNDGWINGCLMQPNG